MSGTEECVRVVADEILKGGILKLDEPLCFPGIAIIPIIKRAALDDSSRRLHIPRSTLKDNILNAIVGSIPLNACGVFILDSLGDVITFKLHKEIYTFWERINYVERIVAENYKDTRKPLSRNGATARVFAFLSKLRSEGTGGVMREKTDYFAISLTDEATMTDSIENHLESTAAILYSSMSK